MNVYSRPRRNWSTRSSIGAPGLEPVFSGYNGPGQIEEFWILDVAGTRLMIQATWFPDSPPQDIAEMRSVLDSIVIEPWVASANRFANATADISGNGRTRTGTNEARNLVQE